VRVDAPVSSRRIASIDLLRGLIMIIMALDHSRDFFSNATVGATDPTSSWPMLYFTRWITHLCAPCFVALAGTSVFLQRQRGRSASELAPKLVTRGLWLIFVELAIVSPGIFFTYHFHFLQVIFAIGGSMILLAALQYLSVRWVLVYGLIVVLLHNALDPIQAAHLGAASGTWKLLISDGPFLRDGKLWALVMYPVIPWSGIMALGYAFGVVVSKPGEVRRRWSLILAAITCVLFVVLRATNFYGDPSAFKLFPTFERSTMAFLNVTKYPPSLDYTCATFTVLLLLFALLDKALEESWVPRVLAVIEIYGRVPFFYYVLHFYILHLAALATLMVVMGTVHVAPPTPILNPAPAAAAFSLQIVYVVWISVVAVLYLPCRWFAGVKARRRDWWLSYL
jgi:uncharacterized membrane protein